MSGKDEEVKTEAEMNQELDADLEKAADEVFGAEEGKTDEELEKEAAAKEAAEKAAAEKATDGEPGDQDSEKSEESEDETTGAKKDEEEAAAAAAEKEAAEKVEAEDPYQIPDDIKGRTRERMEKFRDDLKVAHEDIKKKDDMLVGFREAMTATGLTPGEVQNTLNLGSMLKKDPQRALGVLQGIVTDLSKQVGVIPPGVDPLEGHDDLKQQVEDKLITPEAAKELAEGRARKAADEVNRTRQEEINKQQEEENKSTQSFEEAVKSAQTECKEYLVAAEKDPDFDKIAPKLKTAAIFAAQNLAPDKWLGYLKDEYQKVKDIAAEMAPSSSTTPLTNGGSPQGGDKVAETLDELADQML